MKTVTFPDWIIEFLSSLPIGREALVVIPIEPAPEIEHGPSGEPNGLTWQGKRGLSPADIAGFCPLGAVGERVAVYGTKEIDGEIVRSWPPYCHISLTAEPDVKRVKNITHKEAVELKWRYTDFFALDTFVWLCRVKRV